MFERPRTTAEWERLRDTAARRSKECSALAIRASTAGARHRLAAQGRRFHQAYVGHVGKVAEAQRSGGWAVG